MGIVKSIQVGDEKIYLNDSWSYFALYASSKSSCLATMIPVALVLYGG